MDLSIFRWQLMFRIANGGGPRQADIYLRDWSIKHELRNRAMVYDTGGVVGGGGGAIAINACVCITIILIKIKSKQVMNSK